MSVKKNIDMVSILGEGQLDPQIPRYKAIAKSIVEAIQCGRLEKGGKLPPHRLLSDKLGVTVGTVSRAYSEVEKLGLVVARVGDGTYVRDLDRSEGVGFRAVTNSSPDIIDLSLNIHVPTGEALILRETLERIGADPKRLGTALQYQPDSGSLAHRESGARWLARGGIDSSAENVIVTNGAQHALLCALMAVTRPGDIVAAEGLSYPGLAAVARHLGLRLRGLAIDDEGLIPEALDEACLHGSVRVLFCTPTLHNPTTALMSVARREAIAEVACRHNLVVIEDDVHGTLVSNHPPPLYGFVPERTIFITSLTKAVASGLRVGYMLVPEELRMRVALAVRASCWMATPLSAEIASCWIDGGEVDELIRRQRQEVHRRKRLVDDLLKPLAPTTHPDSLHYWIELPEPWRSSELTEELRSVGVLVKSADAFAIGQYEVPHAIRASVSGVEHDEALLEGFRAIRDLLVVGLRKI